MKTQIIMPQMGESIAEGTVVRWLKKPGERIERDEELFEISTDKVESVIPSPVAGFLAEIVVPEGTRVEVGTTVAWITDTQGEVGAASAAPQPAAAPAAQAAPAAAPAPAPAAPAPAPASTADATADELRKQRSTPLVRRMVKEHGLELSAIEGTGLSGRVTRKDVERYLASGARPAAPKAAAPAAHAPTFEAPEVPVGPRDRVEPLSVMRQNIAAHMVMSRRVSAHCQTVHECDVTWVEQLRKKHKAAYAARGLKLSFTTFLTKAVADALRAYPLMNASLSGTNVIFHDEVNVGVAVALEQGLIVPVVKRADELNIGGLARAVDDLSTRARTKKLAPGDVQDGTFTISNAGVFGSLFGIPIINQPQVGILGVGGVTRRPMVLEDDVIAIRSMVHFCLTFDHRLIDGSVADGFMSKIKDVLKNFPESAL